MIDSSVSQISLDVQAFKNIRNRLFTQITDEIQKEQQQVKKDSKKETLHTHSASNTS